MAHSTELGSRDNALRDIVSAGVQTLDNGDMVVSADTLKRIRNERLRRATVSTVPSTPRYLTRDGGGVGVAKGGTLLGQVTSQALRSIRERAPIFQAIHSARQYQVRRMATPWSGVKGKIGYRVVHKDHIEHDATPPDGFDRFINRFKSVLERPAPQYGYGTTASVLAGLEEDMLTINRPCVEPLHSLLDPDRLVGFKPVDGALVWPTLVWLEKWKGDNPETWHRGYDQDQLTIDDQLELASHAIQADLYAAKHCIVRDGILESVCAPHKMIVAPILNRTDINYTGYPPSHVEQALEMGLGFVNAWDYNANYFTRGMMAEFILGISGDVHDDDVDAFVDMLREATQGVANAWQPPVMPMPGDGVISKIDLKMSNKEMMYEMWLSLTTALSAAVYRMDPSTINAKPWDGGSGGSLGAPNREMEIALAKEEGLQGDIQHLTDNILNPLARRCHPDLRVIWEYGDTDPKKEAELFDLRSKTDMTRNEVRLAQGTKPKGFWVKDDEYDDLSDEDKEKYDSNLWNQPSDPTFVNAYSQAKQMESMADEGQDEGDGFGGGADGAFPGGPEGEEQPEGAPPGEEQPPPGGQPPQEGGGGFPFGQVPEGMNKGRKRSFSHGHGTTVYVHEID